MPFKNLYGIEYQGIFVMAMGPFSEKGLNGSQCMLFYTSYKWAYALCLYMCVFYVYADTRDLQNKL